MTRLIRDIKADERKRCADEVDPRQPPGNDFLLNHIHAELETLGRAHPDRMVSVFHRNIVLCAVADALRK